MASLDSIGGIHYEMMKRCYNKNSVAFKDYGAKGICVCEEWHNRDNFRKWAKENGYVKGMRLNRIDSAKDYTPNNCVFGNKNCKIIGGKNQEAKRIKEENKRKKKEAGINGHVSADDLYITYIAMHERCERETHISYKNYGARGVTVCDEWSGKDGFFNFRKWANESGWIKGLTLDRRDNDRGYEPSNCKWSTKSEQNNNKRNTIRYDYCGMLMPLGMIAKLENVKYCMLYSRVKEKGMSVGQAIADIKKSTD